MTNTIISALTQATSEFAFHVDTLLLVVIAQYVVYILTLSLIPHQSVAPSRGAPDVSKMILASPKLYFPQLVFALSDFIKSCIVFGEAWIAIAKQSINLFSALSSVEMIISDSNTTEQVKLVLIAIKNAKDACARLRIADIQVMRLRAVFEQLLLTLATIPKG